MYRNAIRFFCAMEWGLVVDEIADPSFYIVDKNDRRYKISISIGELKGEDVYYNFVDVSDYAILHIENKKGNNTLLVETNLLIGKNKINVYELAKFILKKAQLDVSDFLFTD